MLQSPTKPDRLAVLLALATQEDASMGLDPVSPRPAESCPPVPALASSAWALSPLPLATPVVPLLLPPLRFPRVGMPLVAPVAIPLLPTPGLGPASESTAEEPQDRMP